MGTPRLALRFAISTALALAVAACLVLWTVRSEAIDSAEQAVVVDAQHAATVLETENVPLASPPGSLPPERLDKLDRHLASENVLLVKVWNADGRVVYASDHRLIGDETDHVEELEKVLEGETERETTELDLDGEQVKALEAFVPFETDTGVGAVELYNDYSIVDRQVRDTVLPVAAVLAVVFLALYALLFPILRATTSKLRDQNARLHDQAADLERSATERERLIEREREQNAKLRTLDRAKDEFIALVSHELRTPLTSIRGYLELVTDGAAGEITPEQAQFLGVVARNAARLETLVGDLLFVAQVEAGRLSLELQEIDLVSIATDAVETARPVAAAKEIELDLVASSARSLAGDPVRIGQMLDNLVSNAIKFTPEGGRVEVRVLEEQETAVLEVADTGLGIPADEQARLFERFFRTSNASAHAVQGTGLGLTISKAIAEAHGGSVTFASVEGMGTTFRVELPLASQLDEAA